MLFIIWITIFKSIDEIIEHYGGGKVETRQIITSKRLSKLCY